MQIVVLSTEDYFLILPDLERWMVLRSTQTSTNSLATWTARRLSRSTGRSSSLASSISYKIATKSCQSLTHSIAPPYLALLLEYRYQTGAGGERREQRSLWNVDKDDFLFMIGSFVRSFVDDASFDKWFFRLLTLWVKQMESSSLTMRSSSTFNKTSPNYIYTGYVWDLPQESRSTEPLTTRQIEKFWKLLMRDSPIKAIVLCIISLNESFRQQ